MTMQQFVTKVDEKVQAEMGVSVHDLPDIDFYAYYDEDLSDGEADSMAEEAVSDIKYDNNFDV